MDYVNPKEFRLASKIVQFFSGLDFTERNGAKTLENFFEKYGLMECIDIGDVVHVCKTLCTKNILVEIGTRGDRFIEKTYYTRSFSEKSYEYGVFESLAYGFSWIRENFSHSVLPVIVSNLDGEEDIGSGFFVGNVNTFFTARHVVENMNSIQIGKGNLYTVKNIRVSKNEKLDVACLLVGPSSGNMGIKPFQVTKDVDVLTEVMSMGFPPIPGFEDIQVCDVSHINSEVKVSQGTIVANSKSYLSGLSCLLINARVKGGNSGGPIVDEMGYVCGILSNMPMDSHKLGELDSLGYGVALHPKYLSELLDQSRVQSMPFKMNADGTWCTLV